MRKPSGLSSRSLLVAAVIVAAIAAAVVLLVRTDLTGKKGSGLGKDFSYDLGELRKIDPKLLHYKEAAAIETGMTEARGLAIDAADRLYVAGDKAIHILAAQGNKVAEIAVGQEPQCVAVTKDAIYVGLRDHVEVYDPEGTQKASWQSLGEKAVVTAVAAAEGDVFVADAGNAMVVRYDSSGKLLARIGLKDRERNIPGLVVPSPYFDLAVGPDGLLWAANPGRQRIEAYTFSGDLEASWGRSAFAIDGFCGCCNPTNFAIFPDGRFVTSEKGLPRVKVYSPEGRLESVVAPPQSFARQAAGLDLAIDSKGQIFVLDPVARTVRVFVRTPKP